MKQNNQRFFKIGWMHLFSNLTKTTNYDLTFSKQKGPKDDDSPQMLEANKGT